MPELPEVTALASTLDARLREARVATISLRSVAALKTFDPALDALCALEVSGCARHGKFIDLSLSPLHLVVHLARAGWMRLHQSRSGEDRASSMRGPLVLRVRFEDGRVLDVTEAGTEHRLAVYVVRNADDVPGIRRLGPDALSPALDVESLQRLLGGHQGTLKSVLADQSVIAGVGNAYSDEILHAARLSPFRRADSLDGAEVETVHHAIHEVLERALADARSVAPESLKQAKRIRMNVHGRTGEKCPVCGDVIRQVSYANRSFQYCAGCQTGGRVYADRRMSRLLK
jgi:formamidopyrimidine-DNA glycosylase